MIDEKYDITQLYLVPIVGYDCISPLGAGPVRDARDTPKGEVPLRLPRR